MQFMVIVERGTSSYGAYVPDLPGCVAVARTRKEVLKLIREAVELLSRDELNRHLQTVTICPLTTQLHPQWQGRLQIVCAGKSAEIAVDQIRTIDKMRLQRRIDHLTETDAAQLRRLISEAYC